MVRADRLVVGDCCRDHSAVHAEVGGGWVLWGGWADNCVFSFRNYGPSL